jgi:hypothetical protein
MTEQLPLVVEPATSEDARMTGADGDKTGNEEDLNIRVKTMDSSEYKLLIKANSTVNDLKTKIEEVSLKILIKLETENTTGQAEVDILREALEGGN